MPRLTGTGGLLTGRQCVRFVVGDVPKALERSKRWAADFRRTLEDACLDIHGEVDVLAAARIDCATSAELGAAIVRWCWRFKWDQLDASQVCDMAERLVRLKERRNAQIEKLNLTRDRTAAIQALYSDSVALPAPEPSPPVRTRPGASGATTEASPPEPVVEPEQETEPEPEDATANGDQDAIAPDATPWQPTVSDR